MYKLIKSYSEFVLNETLKTHDIDKTIYNIDWELSLMYYEFNIIKVDNMIELELKNLDHLKIKLDHLDSLFIDRHGWFPSKMILTKQNGMSNKLAYSEEKILKINDLSIVKIVYEPKYDIERVIPDKLYHLTIREYINKINKNGLVPKSKSKLSNHLDRIYVCKDQSDCYKLIAKMKLYFLDKKHIDFRYVIYEIDMIGLNIKMYNDPNFSKGYYIIDNINKERLTIVDKEN